MTDALNPRSEADANFKPFRQQPSLAEMEERGLAVEGNFTGINCVTIGNPRGEDRVIPVYPVHVTDYSQPGEAVNVTYFAPTKQALADMRAEVDV